MYLAQERSVSYDRGVGVGQRGQAYAFSGLESVIRHQVNRRRGGKGYLAAKRIFDILSSLCLLAVIWPVFLVIAGAVKLDSKGPVIYRHKRIAQDGAEFYLYKFRSMVVNAEEMIEKFTPAQKREWENNFKLADDPRITRSGAFLRRTSLDELPQLINILQGNLSVVGPRPIVEEELEKYGPDKARFLRAKPGLTGYWQAYVRSDCSYEQRMDMELFYVDNANFWWDLKIVFATIRSLLKGKGAV